MESALGRSTLWDEYLAQPPDWPVRPAVPVHSQPSQCDEPSPAEPAPCGESIERRR